jgi:hypothetical protein
MKVYYRILNIDSNEHSITVRYFTDTYTEDQLASEFESDGSIKRTEQGYPTRCRTDLNLTIYETPSPTKDDIITLINHNAPRVWLELHDKVIDSNVDTSLSSITDLHHKSNELPEIKVKEQKLLSDDEIDNLLKKITS